MEAKVYGVTEYLMIMHEDVTARLNYRARKAHQQEGSCRPPDRERAKKEKERDG
jgi:hypothetical protein